MSSRSNEPSLRTRSPDCECGLVYVGGSKVNWLGSFLRSNPAYEFIDAAHLGLSPGSCVLSASPGTDLPKRLVTPSVAVLFAECKQATSVFALREVVPLNVPLRTLSSCVLTRSSSSNSRASMCP